MALISASELAALQALAESGMVVSVAVFNAVNVETADGQETTYPATADFSVQGWFHKETGSGATIGVLDGGGGIAELLRLTVPVGTDLNSGDKVVFGGIAYFVQSTSASDTYPVWLKAYLRVIT